MSDHGATFVACAECGRLMLGQLRGEAVYPQPHQCVEDMRKSGEAFCAACPDHEGCATGWPCALVREVHRGGDR